MMKINSRSLLLIAAAAISFCLLICTNIGRVFDFSCEEYLKLAELNADNERLIVIYEKGCWELQRPLLYEITENGVVVSPKYPFDYDNGQKQYTYSLVYAGDKSLIGVVETTRSSSRVIAIFDFNSGDSWPRQKTDEWMYKAL